jgi:hypothetical protein
MRVHITSLTSPLLLNSRTNPRQSAAMYMCWFWLRFYILSIRIWNCSDCVIFLHFVLFCFVFVLFFVVVVFILLFFFFIIFTYIMLTIATQIYLSNIYMYIWELSVADNRSNNNGSAVICFVFLIVCLLLIFIFPFIFILLYLNTSCTYIN